MYSLPRAALGDNLSTLADALLGEAGSAVQMETLARRLAGEINLAGEPIAKRLNLIVERSNQMNYHAHWEAGSAGPRVIFGHCPYAAIIETHPELCKMDEVMLEKWMGQSGTQISKIGKDGSSVCVFVIG